MPGRRTVEMGQEHSIQQRWRLFRRRRRQPHNRDELMQLRPTPVQLFWGALGLLAGIVTTVIVLLVIAPEAPAAVATPPAASDVSITLDDTALSNLTAAGIAQAGLPFTITNIHAHILPNSQVQISGDVPILGGIAVRRLSATATVVAQQGHIALQVRRASVGGFDLPEFVTRAIESSFNTRSAQLTSSLNVANMRYAVSGVSSTDGKLTFMLSRAP